MIPADFITEWRAHVRWSADEQVEQDLVLCRALVEIFDDAELAVSVSLRGGTALHKLYFAPARRYSEDIDIVQMQPGPIGTTIDRLRAKLDHWLGVPRWERGEGVRGRSSRRISPERSTSPPSRRTSSGCSHPASRSTSPPGPSGSRGN